MRTSQYIFNTMNTMLSMATSWLNMGQKSVVVIRCKQQAPYPDKSTRSRYSLKQ